jgi:hypothetical protein
MLSAAEMEREKEQAKGVPPQKRRRKELNNMFYFNF